MANFASIATTLEGIINTQLSLTRSDQGVWEWFNSLQKVMSSNRFSGTPRVVGPALISAETAIETGAVVLFGVLVDNSMAAEDGYLAIVNLTTANWTAGTDNALAYLWSPRNTQQYYVFPKGITMDTAFTIEDILGTEVGLEAGTGTTSGLTHIVVYTE